MKRLFGIHMTPPERAVVPPISGVFSSTATDFPSLRKTSALHIEPPPLPTTTKSKVSSKVSMGFAFQPEAIRQPLLLSGLSRTSVRLSWRLVNSHLPSIFS